MAAIDFPNSPSVNDIHTVGTRSWKWTGSVWESVTVTVSGPTGPAGDNGTNGTNAIVSVNGTTVNPPGGTTQVLSNSSSTASNLLLDFYIAEAYPAGITYLFDTSTTMALPTANTLRFNSATMSSVTAIAINDSAYTAGSNVAPYILTWDDSTSTVKGTLVITYINNKYFAVFDVTGLTDNSGWTQLAVTHISSTALPSLNDVLSLQFSRAGDPGATGTAATISVGATTTGNPGTSASVSSTGPSSSPTLSFTVPQGPTGPASTTAGPTGSAGIVSSTTAPGDTTVLWLDTAATAVGVDLDVWTAYTPTWLSNGGTAPSIGNGTITGRYKQIGKVVSFQLRLTFGSTTTGGTLDWKFGLPVTAQNTNYQFSASILDTGANWYGAIGNGTYLSSTTEFVCMTPTNNAAVYTWSGVTASQPITFGTGDYIVISGTYEAA
jgi:hypothetical protein